MSSTVAVATVEHLPIADNSVDLIFTDPPYERAQLNTYVWLAQEAKRVLRPGGFLLAMCGGSFLNQIFRFFDGAGLVYYWEHRVLLTGQRPGCVWRGQSGNDRLNMPVSIQTKPMLAYSKGRAIARSATVDLIKGDGKDKRFHAWGQDVNSARYCIECYSSPGELVCDRFAGEAPRPSPVSWSAGAVSVWMSNPMQL